jgi:hypothetical protein
MATTNIHYRPHRTTMKYPTQLMQLTTPTTIALLSVTKLTMIVTQRLTPIAPLPTPPTPTTMNSMMTISLTLNYLLCPSKKIYPHSQQILAGMAEFGALIPVMHTGPVATSGNLRPKERNTRTSLMLVPQKPRQDYQIRTMLYHGSRHPKQ